MEEKCIYLCLIAGKEKGKDMIGRDTIHTMAIGLVWICFMRF